ncbi:acyltransferase family protein [Dyadobacter sp. CY343]|uniref:acyltransferase family protein n=1 Tax=Dyadobacter sp. CY343 TaxID=2907299 RepID=UPI001F24CA2D|nr:acyltransferase family protein [Dyadobacter sp. CY343]MCE7059698.1 acyltransferase [Dyadobacter sp. CY343]
MTKSTDKFRYDINALRAIAVIGVVLFHFKLPFFSGGFAGVDVFFVISGYLMSRIVITGIESGKFSILNFYARRAQRIIPALSFLILCLFIFCFFVYLPIDYKVVAKNAIASLLFYSNVLYNNSNYFDPSSDTNMLLHTWSLSVEWQFYLILPVGLVAVNRLFRISRSGYLYLFSLSIISIFLVTLFITKYKPNSSFYLLPTRSWEMLLGGLAFLTENKIQTRYNKIIAIIGYAVIFSCFYLLNETLPWPGIYTLPAVLGTFLIICMNINDFKVLRYEFTQYLGKISYSLYLWHWPLYVIAIYLGVETSLVTSIILIIASLLAATISYKYIESIRFENNLRLVSGSVALVIIGLVFANQDVNRFIFDQETLNISQYSQTHQKEHDDQFSVGKCFITAQHDGLKDYNADQCLELDINKKNYLLIGDSHSAHLSQSLREIFLKNNMNLIQASGSGCLPLIKKNGKIRCTELIDFVYKNYLPKNASNIDGVIISANWVSGDHNELPDEIEETIAYLKKLSLNTIILGQNETYTIAFSSIAARETEYGKLLRNRYRDDKSRQINSILKDRLKSRYIEIYDMQGVPKLTSKNTPYMYDQNHYTKSGADLVTQIIWYNPLFQKFLLGQPTLVANNN